MSAPATVIPGYVAGKWNIDPVHSGVNFIARHLGVSKVRGQFGEFGGEIVTGETIIESSVTAVIQAASVNTGNSQRDDHLRSADFLDAGILPTLAFHSSGVRADGENLLIDGELTMHGVTKPVTLNAELGGFGPGMTEGSTVMGVSATTEIKRSEFGIGASMPVAVVSDKIKIELEIEAVLEG